LAQAGGWKVTRLDEKEELSMKFYNRPFDDGRNDFKKLWDFLVADYANRKDNFIWSLGRLTDWKYGLWHEKKFIPTFLRKNAQLWLNFFDEPVGFAISEEGDNMFFIMTACGYEFLYDEILCWVLENWGGRGQELVTEVHEFQETALRVLREKGFVTDGKCATTRMYPLRNRCSDYMLCEGFTITDMTRNRDYKGKRLMQANAFRNVNTVSELDLLAYEYNRESPVYEPYYDLSVIDEAGRHASGCLAFVDYANGYAEVERVCTHSDFRRKGLCEAVIRECFSRLKVNGIEYAYITGYSSEANGLYEKLSPVKRKSWFHYKLKTRE
jgi:hypothetical protein